MRFKVSDEGLCVLSDGSMLVCWSSKVMHEATCHPSSEKDCLAKAVTGERGKPGRRVQHPAELLQGAKEADINGALRR